MPYTKRVIVLDLETQKGFNEVDRSKLYQLKVSVVGIYDSYDDAYLSFEEKDFLKLEERLKLADLIVGFNINGFDMKVLTPYLDLLDEIHKSCGHRVSLQSLAEGTFKDSKSGSGWNAIRLFRDGRMDELKKYCLDDVRLTKRIFDYGLEHKKVSYFSNRDFRVHDIAIDWSAALNLNVTEQSFPTSLF
jgi:hypothetical protein